MKGAKVQTKTTLGGKVHQNDQHGGFTIKAFGSTTKKLYSTSPVQKPVYEYQDASKDSSQKLSQAETLLE